MQAYSQSKIAVGLLGLELHRRSQAHAWGMSSNLSHPGVAPTNLLAARPELGRSADASGRGLIRLLSERGVILATVETAKLPALVAATDPAAKPAARYGPSGLGHLGGPPAEQRMYAPLCSTAAASRIWEASERLTGMAFPVI